MPKIPLTAADAITLFLYGRRYEFFQPKLQANVSNTLGAGHFEGTPANPTRVQKHQIVLHCTAGLGGAESNVHWWNSQGVRVQWASAHYVLEKHGVTAPLARPALQPGAHRNDANLADAVQLALEDAITFHAGAVNWHSIGIEQVNEANLPRLQAVPPPTDQNSFIQVQNAGLRRGQARNFAAYEDEQYATVIMLLRHLCIAHRIPRRFLGETLADALGQYMHARDTPLPLPGAVLAPDTPAAIRGRTVEVRHFRGILHHNQVHRSKSCPGVEHRNRIFRGIIDQFWLPVSVAGQGERNYYSGPFKKPAGDQTSSLFHFARRGTHFVGTTYRDADAAKLYDTSHFFDLNQVEAYFAATESAEGGTYPIGRNKVWHGGVHFHPPADYPAVFASASGTIVAARLTSNPLTEAEPGFGSQRFVLVQHVVSFAQQPDTSGTPPPVGHLGADRTRTDYTQGQYVYTLYMHLAPFADLAKENDQNPPWFNLWRRANPGVQLVYENAGSGLCANDQRGQVFCPDIPVNAGDVLGLAGGFAGKPRVLHFEVFTGQHTQFGGHIGRWGVTPWEATGPGTGGVEDRDTNIQAGPELIRRLLPGTPLTPRNLRDLKTLHMSEWAVEDESQLVQVIPNAAERSRQFIHRRRFSWVADAISASRSHANANHLAGGDLTAREFFGGADALFWHYHPIVFMRHANRLVQQESAEIIEQSHAASARINCLLDDDGFLKRFVEFSAATNDYQPIGANGSAVTPFDVNIPAGHNRRQYVAYQCTLLDISCHGNGAHLPNQSPPQETCFALSLLDVIEEIRAHFNADVRVLVSYLCPAHVGRTNGCVMNDAAHVAEHARGLAVDLAPANPTVANCQSLVESAEFVRGRFNEDANEGAGNPGFSDYPAGISQMVVEHLAMPTTPSGATLFRVHIALRG